MTRAEAVVYVLDEQGRKRANPEVFGVGGYECYDPEDLVKLIAAALREERLAALEEAAEVAMSFAPDDAVNGCLEEILKLKDK